MDAVVLIDLARQVAAYAGTLIAAGALAKIGESSTDTSVAWLKGAWTSLQQRFKGNRQAEAALTVFEFGADKPANQELVAEQIVAVYQNDQAAIAELQALVAELQRLQPAQPAPQRVHNQTIGDKAKVGIAIAGDVHAPVTNIGGNVSGNVLSGTFNEPVTIGPVRNINTGGGDYAEGNIDKSRRTIISGTPARVAKPDGAPTQTRGDLPATLSADGVHFSYGYALLIGVGRYISTKHTVPTTANDASQLGTLLTDPALAAYPQNQVTLLQNQTATRQGILDAFAALTERLKAAQHAPHKPTVVVYYAGHGINSNNSFALLPHDYDANNRSTTTISDRAFRKAVQDLIPYCQKMLVLINCCYAGGTAGQVLSESSAAVLGGAPSRTYIESLASGSGQVVISSSRSSQPSSAEADDNRQLTTFGSKLLNALRGKAKGDGPAVGVLDLFAHLASAVPADARGVVHEGKALEQQPLLYAREVDQNFPVALRPLGQQRGTLDADETDAVQRLAQIEIELFGYDSDDDAPALVAEREALLRKLGAA